MLLELCLSDLLQEKVISLIWKLVNRLRSELVTLRAKIYLQTVFLTVFSIVARKDVMLFCVLSLYCVSVDHLADVTHSLVLL